MAVTNPFKISNNCHWQCAASSHNAQHNIYKGNKEVFYCNSCYKLLNYCWGSSFLRRSDRRVVSTPDWPIFDVSGRS